MRSLGFVLLSLVFCLQLSGSIELLQGRIQTAVPPPPRLDSALNRVAVAVPDYEPGLQLYTQRRTSAIVNDLPRTIFFGGQTLSSRSGWRMRGKDAANTSHSDVSGPAMQVQPAWVFQPGFNAFVWRPAVAPDGTIYVTTLSFGAGGMDGRLYALRADGSVKWQAPMMTAGGVPLWTSATPIVDTAGNVYVAWAHDQNGNAPTILSFNNAGVMRWRLEAAAKLPNASHQQPVLNDGVLYAALDTRFSDAEPDVRASIYAVNSTTGRQVWQWNSPHLDTFFAGPAVGRDGYIYHASSANPLRGSPAYLYRLRPNGRLDWDVAIGPGVIEPPAIDSDGDAYLGDLEGRAFKFDSDGDLKWSYDTMSGQIYMSPVLSGSRVLVGAANAGLHVLDAGSGRRIRVFAPTQFPMSSASDEDGNAFFYAFNGEGTVFGFGREGRQRWQFDTGSGSSVNSLAVGHNGRLLVSNSQTLSAYVSPVLGDLNCDSRVDFSDIQPYILALVGEERYVERYRQCSYSLADVNGDGEVNGFDTIPFLLLLRN